jgi:uncharacterized membrane protein YjfL (UPF0719 family)
MIGTRTTTAMVVALAAIGVFGALATIGNQAVFAQVTNTNNNAQSQTANLSCSNTQTGNVLPFATLTCSVNQEMGNCQVNVGANDESTASSQFESEDCS